MRPMQRRARTPVCVLLHTNDECDGRHTTSALTRVHGCEVPLSVLATGARDHARGHRPQRRHRARPDLAVATHRQPPGVPVRAWLPHRSDHRRTARVLRARPAPVHGGQHNHRHNPLVRLIQRPLGGGESCTRSQTAWSRRERFGWVLFAGVLCCRAVAVQLSCVCLVSRGSAIGITAVVPAMSRMRRTCGGMQVKTRLIRACLAARWILSRELTPAAPQKLTSLRSSNSTRAGRRSALMATSVNESTVAMSISPATARRTERW